MNASLRDSVDTDVICGQPQVISQILLVFTSKL